MKISIIDTGFFKLDGGAMFGIVPKTLWKRMNPPDESNKCTWAMRCLLIEHQDRKILIDTGIGDKQDQKFKQFFEPTPSKLLASLQERGVASEAITDVLLTHLHFDHAGGATFLDNNGNLKPTFPNATYWTNKLHYDWACHPNAKEKASFLKDNFVPLQQAGVLRFLDAQKNELPWLAGISLQYVYGHTEAMATVKIKTPEQTFIYCADLMPSSYHIRMPYVMSYDIRPLETLKEKRRLLEAAVQEQTILIFEHDPLIECATIVKDESGRYSIGRTGKLTDWIQTTLD